MSRSRSRERGTKSSSGGGGEDASRIFIGNISFNTREEDLKPLFTKYGPVTELRVATERDTGRSRGFAFLTMEDSRDAQDAIDGLKGHEIDGREIRVELSRPRDSAPRGGDRYGGARSDVCYDWLKNRCSRGSSCRFSHSESGGGGGDDRWRDDRDDRGGRDRGGRDRDRDDDDRGGRDRDSGRDRGGRDRDRDDDRGGRDRDSGRDRGGRDRDRDDDRGGRDRDRDDDRGGRDRGGKDRD